MKKRILLFTAIAGLGYVTLTSYDNGAANSGGLNRTGAKATLTTCGGSGCHGTGTSTTVTITVDTATTSTAVTQYTPGKLYTIKIHGTGTSAQPQYGFQFASVKGSGASQTQAGTASSLPTNVRTSSLSGLSIIEHSAPLVAATAGTYDVSFQWTAPVAGTGNVTMYCTLNAVNGDDVENSADISGNTSVVLSERVPLAVAAITNNISVTAYPNPMTNNLNLLMDHADAGTYKMQAFDMNGRIVATDNIVVNGANSTTHINTGAWAIGAYHISLQKDGFSKTVRVVKN